MLRRIALVIAALLIFSLPISAQDGLNLPADLYVLLNNGQIQRYGVGASGVVNLTPENFYIIDFGIDAPGERLAFRTESGLFAMNLGIDGEPIPLEGATADVPTYRGSGETMAWSPNGDAIAYTTTYGARIFFNTGTTAAFVDLREGIFKGLTWSPGGSFLAAEAEDNIWWVYRRDGFNLVLSSVIPSSVGTAWISNSELVFAPADGSLRIMNLDQANAQAVLLDESVIYRLPILDTHDSLLFFGRNPNDSDVPDGYGRLLRLARGAQQLETIGEVPIALNGLRWVPGGSLLVAFQGGVIALYDPSTGLGFPLPITDVVAYTWGPPGQPAATQQVIPAEPAQPTEAPPPGEAPQTAPEEPTVEPVSTVNALTLAADGFFLAPEPRGIIQVWRLPANGSLPQPFTLSGSDVNEFAASPDGRQVAYVVEAELWLQVVGQQPKMLARINSFAPVEADFSGDGTQIAYVDERSGVWWNVLADDAPQLVRAIGEESFHRPQFSPDGTKLLLEVSNSVGLVMGVLDLANRELVTSPVTSGDDPRPTRARWLRDGRIYTFVDGSSPSSLAPGFYLIDAEAPGETAGQWIPIDPDITIRASTEAVSGELRVIQARGTGAFAPLSVVDYDLTSGNATRILDIGAVVAPQISPEGRFVSGYDSLNQIDGVQQGAIVIIDLQNGRRYQLSNPPAAWGFRWTAP